MTPTEGAPPTKACEATPDEENGSSSPEATPNEETGPTTETLDAAPNDEEVIVESGVTANSSTTGENVANATKPAITPGSPTTTDGSEAMPASVALRNAFRPEHVRRPRGYVGPWSPYEIYEDQMLPPRVEPGSLGIIGSVRDYLLGV